MSIELFFLSLLSRTFWPWEVLQFFTDEMVMCMYSIVSELQKLLYILLLKVVVATCKHHSLPSLSKDGIFMRLEKPLLLLFEL